MSGKRLLLLLLQNINVPPIIHNARITEDNIIRITEDNDIRVIEGTLLFELARKMLLSELKG